MRNDVRGRGVSMADGVKWIKFMIGCTDGSSFKRMRNAKIGGVDYRDKLEAIWFELLDFAGVCNHGGAFIDDREIPYSNIADIATQISRTEEELELCMQFYINTGMVEIIDNIYMLSNWSKYQNNDYLTDKREYDRIKQQEYRARQKAIVENQKQVQQLPTTFDENNEKNEDEEKNVKNVNDLSMTNVKNSSYSISISYIYNNIKEMYIKCGYKTKLHKTNTIKKLTTICNNKDKKKRLHPLLVLMSYGVYLAECRDSHKESDYVKQSDTFLTSMVYDYAEQVEGFEERVVQKYGENWKKYRLVE